MLDQNLVVYVAFISLIFHIVFTLNYNLRCLVDDFFNDVQLFNDANEKEIKEKTLVRA